MAFWIAGLMTAAIVPYTMAIMGSVNDTLMEAANADGRMGLGDEEVKDLVRRWSWLNAARGVLPLVGGVVGMWSELCDLEA